MKSATIVLLAALHAQSALAGQANVSIRYVGIPPGIAASGAPTLGTVDVSVIQGAAGCEYRLEFNDPEVKTNWPLSEIAGDQGPPQRYVNVTCTPPAFTAGPTDSLRQYEEQTAYYWSKQAREYAVRRLWIAPPGWTAGPFKLANDGVGVTVMTDGAFQRSCWPQPRNGCMRDYPHEGPKIHLRAGSVAVNLVAHEFGHYAAGYVFGHMDPLSVDSKFDFSQCDIRSFQEAVADVFEVLFLHEIGGPRTLGGAGSAQWNNACGASDYVMGRPLAEAVEDAVRGTAADTTLNFSWASPAEANAAMANAFVYGLASTSGHKIDMLAYAMLRWLAANQPQRAGQVRAMFAAHGMAPMPTGTACSTNQGCASGYCDAGDGTSKTSRCVPAPQTGVNGEFCSHDNQCRTLRCAGLTPSPSGGWTPGVCGGRAALGQGCSQHTQCASGYCDAGWNTSKTNLCMPHGDGRGGDPCSNHNQCTSRVCAGLRTSGNAWIPGTCSTQGGLGQGCSQHGQCVSGYCDAGWNTSQTNLCMPNGNGRRNDPCSNHNQCTSRLCNGLRASGNRWIPGTCN